jgi:putative oxidoreductase
MATILSSQRDHVWQQNTKAGAVTANWIQAVAPLGRLLFSLIFILSGIGHFSAPTIEYAASQGVPMANLLVPLSGILAILGGISVLSGYKARIGALMLLAFLVPVTLMMHNFWDISDPMMRQNQMAHFMKNLALMGTTLLIFHFGSGPYSVDSTRLNQKKIVQVKGTDLDEA